MLFYSENGIGGVPIRLAEIVAHPPPCPLDRIPISMFEFTVDAEQTMLTWPREESSRDEMVRSVTILCEEETI